MVASSRRISAAVIASLLSGTTAFVAPVPSSSKAASNTNLAVHNSINGGDDKSLRDTLQAAFLGVMIAVAVPQAALADGQTKDFRLPPIDFGDTKRCVLTSSAIGQANAARDKLYDLRMCDLSGASAVGFDLSGVIMTKTNMANTKLEGAYFSKGYLRDSNFEGADFTNAIVDRASFKGSSLRGASFKNSVLTGTSFEGADVEGADFTEAALGLFDQRGLCKNPTLKGQNPKTGVDTLESAGCIPSA
eukprot:CAMPEP_0198142202 /NCGR_PEP_ID=MMETSP1443-20131203/5066_1 /TAXON_ID=186043 /ORGANISM="Entomoneis sp., Strain CCMP2396" /LENGTH=246 /DNA_ID=CAMNT_0043805163 /DNA_START=119 /DNA_END=859 /DNA_ORIENTATION=+